MQKAFLYQERYFLLPEGINDVDELTALHGGDEIEVWECIEKKCMAPYFVNEFMVLSVITLGNGEIYPCEVEILSMLEYNRRLRARVEGYCDGCPNFGELTDSESSLQGHHEEITLDGKCFLREKAIARTPDLAMMVNWLVEDFPSLGLEKLIDEGKTAEATAEFEKLFADTLFEPVPGVILTKAEDGRYGLYFIAMFDDSDSLIKEYIVDELDSRYGKTWDFQHFLPKGVLTHESAEPVGIVFERAEGERASLNATVYVGNGNPIRAYLYLCELIGEERLHTACSSLASSIGTADGMRSPSEFALEVDEVLEEYDEKEIALPAIRVAASFADGEGEPPSYMINYRSDCLMFAFTVPVSCGNTPLNIWNRGDIISMFGLEIARVRFKLPFNPLLCEDPEQFECFLDEIDSVCNYIGDSMCAKCYGQEYDSNEYAVDFIALSLPQLMYKLRYLSPMMTKYGAVLDVYTQSGKSGGRYEISYGMKKLMPENKLWNGETKNEET